MGASLHRHLTVQEMRLHGTTFVLPSPFSCFRSLTAPRNRKLPVSEEDLLYLFEEINRGRSVAPPFEVPTRPCVMRWKKELGLAWDNLVVFEREEGER